MTTRDYGAILYMISSLHLMLSSIVYSYVSLYSSLTDGYTFDNVGTLIGNLLYVFGYLFYLIGEYLQLHISRSIATQLVINSETTPLLGSLDKNKRVFLMFKISALIFAVSAFAYVVMSVNTCLTGGWTQSNIGTLTGNSLYTIGCFVYVGAELQRKLNPDVSDGDNPEAVTFPLGFLQQVAIGRA